MQHALLPWRHEQDGITRASGTARSSDPVDVSFGVVRDVVIDHMTDPFHVQSSRRDIGGDEYVECTGLEAPDGLLPIPLRHVAVDSGSTKTTGHELLCKLGGANFGTHEHQHRLEWLHLQDSS